MKRNTTPTVPAADRLAAVRAEIDALTAPMADAAADVDIDALTATIAGRSARAQALTLTIPALERAVLDERLIEIGERIDELVVTCDKLAEAAHEVADRESLLTAERVEAVAKAANAKRDVEWWLRERELCSDALRRHDEAHTITGSENN